jgi:H+-translocating NAD(P) transhydrogenase subunit alpha
MKIAVLKERRPFERRVAASPETVKRLRDRGIEVVVESGAGSGAAILDSEFAAAGATIAPDAAATLGAADIVLKVQRPCLGGREGGVAGEIDELALMKSGAVLIGLLQPFEPRAATEAYAAAGVSAFALEFIPRITRAQSMDVLSSQANLAGYRAVLEAAAEFGRAFPMMMTAAGTIPPTKIFIMGAGVAGLQAIATARRLGAVVSATDVRAAAKEQVESLGATFVTVDLEAMKAAETAGGYAKEMSADFQRRQREKIHETLSKTDIAICTALIPGRRAPVLITREMVADMKPGAVIVDLAVEQGGNCEGSRFGETVVTENGVRIIGPANLPSRIAVDATRLYAKNVLNFLGLLLDKEGRLRIDRDDEIVNATLVTHGGAVVHPQLQPVPAAPETAPAPLPSASEPLSTDLGQPTDRTGSMPASEPADPATGG